MVGKQFLAITKPVTEDDYINKVEVLSISEEMYFDDKEFISSTRNGENTPAIVINNQSKFISALVFDVFTHEVFRLSEVNLIFEVTNLPIKIIDELLIKAKEIIASKTAEGVIENSKFQEIDEDINIHLDNLVKLGYNGDEIKQHLQEFVDEKYPDLNLKIDIKQQS